LLTQAPIALPSPVPEPALTAGDLRTVMGNLAQNDALMLPGGSSATVADLSAAGVAMAVADDPNAIVVTNPIAALGFALAVADWSGRAGAVDLSGVLPTLPLVPVRLVLPQLPAGQSTDVLASAVPAGLTLRPGCALLLAGVTPDGWIVAGVSDPARQVAGHPRLELAILSAATVAPLLSLAGATLDASGTTVTPNKGTSVRLTEIDPALATRLVNGAGILFVDQVPLRPKGAMIQLAADPVVPALPTALVGRVARLQTALDGRLLGVTGGGSPLARARYRPWRPDWEWVTGAGEVDGYTIRELADTAGLTFGTFMVGSGMGDGAYVHLFEEVANKLVIAAELDAKRIFDLFQHADWVRVLSEWPAVQAAFDADMVPPGPASWSEADQVLAFAEREGMRAVGAQHLLGNGDIPDSVVQGGFSNDELRKILEYMVKTRVIQYRGRIQVWEGAAEVSSILLFGTAGHRFWFDRLGTGIIDDVFRWAHEADPAAKLTFTEDHVLEPDNDAQRQVAQQYFEFLHHFRDAGVPVDEAVIENNLWVFAPPAKAAMIATLRTIQDLGFAIGTGETTVTVSDVDPLFPGRQPTVQVTNKLEAQAALYAAVLDAYLTVGGEFGTGGFTDRWSWLDTYSGSDAMMCDTNYEPKPAYFALRDTLKQWTGLP
jgi:endo-1,4-beta-xylanase